MASTPPAEALQPPSRSQQWGDRSNSAVPPLSSSLSLLIVDDDGDSNSSSSNNMKRKETQSAHCTPPPLQCRGTGQKMTTTGADADGKHDSVHHSVRTPEHARPESPERCLATVTPQRTLTPPSSQRVAEWVVRFSPLPCRVNQHLPRQQRQELRSQAGQAVDDGHESRWLSNGCCLGANREREDEEWDSLPPPWSTLASDEWRANHPLPAPQTLHRGSGSGNASPSREKRVCGNLDGGDEQARCGALSSGNEGTSYYAETEDSRAGLGRGEPDYVATREPKTEEDDNVERLLALVHAKQQRRQRLSAPPAPRPLLSLSPQREKSATAATGHETREKGLPPAEERGKSGAQPITATPADPGLVSIRVSTLSGMLIRLTVNPDMSLGSLCDHVATYLRVPPAQLGLKYLPCDWMLAGHEVERVRHRLRPEQARALRESLADAMKQEETERKEEDRGSKDENGMKQRRGKTAGHAARKEKPPPLPAHWPLLPLCRLPGFPSPPRPVPLSCHREPLSSPGRHSPPAEASRAESAKGKDGEPVLFLLILLSAPAAPRPGRDSGGKALRFALDEAKEKATDRSEDEDGMQTPPQRQAQGSGEESNKRSPWQRLSPPAPLWMRNYVSQLSPVAKRHKKEK